MNIKTIITTYCAGISLFLVSQTGFAQNAATNLSSNLASLLPKNDHLIGCGFISSKPENLWWACELNQASDGKDLSNQPTAWLLPIDNQGKLGQGFTVNGPARGSDDWVEITAWGQTNVLAEISEGENIKIVALPMPSSASNQNGAMVSELWQYTPPKSLNSQEKLAPVNVTAAPDGGYVLLLQDFSAEAAEKKQDRFTVVRLTGEGKEAWQYSYVKEIAAGTSPDEIIPVDDLKKWVFLTQDQKAVIYGSTYENANSEGTFLACLDEKGQEINYQFYKDYYWGQYINGINEGFGFINYPHDTEDHVTDFSISFFDKNCQKISDTVINFPTHNLKGDVYNEIKTTGLTAKGDLVIVYTQVTAEVQNEEADLPPPTMYVAEINSQGQFVQEIPLITSENEDRHYLEVFMDEENYDSLKTTLAFLPQSNEVLISIHNMGTDPEVYPNLKADFWFPRIYKVKLQ